MIEDDDPRLTGRQRVMLVVLSAMILLALGIYLCLRQDNEWERVFITASARLWTGDDIYRLDGAYLYPPFTAWATLPFIGLSHAASRIGFVSVNLASLVVVLVFAWRLAGRPSLAKPEGRWTVLAGAGCGIFYFNNCLVHQQTDVVIAALLLGGCLALINGRPILAATGFGFATAMKCTPLLWAPYLVWRRRPAAAAWLVAVALSANLLPDLVSRPAEGGTWLGVFVGRYLAPLTRSDHVPGTWNSEIIYNQSLAGAAQRWLLTKPHRTGDPRDFEMKSAAFPPIVVRGLLLVVELVLVGLATRGLGRPFQRARDRETEVLEYGVVLVLMLLLSPMSSAAHFGTLVLPGMCLARRAFEHRDRALAVVLLAALLAACASNKDLLGGPLYTLALWCGCVMLNALLLLAGSLRELTRVERGSEPLARNLRTAA